MLISGDAPDRRPDRSIVVLCVVAAVAFTVRIAAAVVLDGLRHPEVYEYDGIARNLIAGRGFSFPHLNVIYHSYAAPLPAWIGAASYWLTGSLGAAMLLQIVAGTMLAVVTALVATRLFGGWLAALGAGLLVALHPGLVLYSAAKSHPLAFDSLLFSAVLLQSFRLVERTTIGRAAFLGVIIGVGALSRTTIAVFLPMIAIWLMAVTRRPARRTALTCIFVSTVCAAAVIAPWTIRNTLLHDRFVPVLTTDTFVFWLGNNPGATGGAYVDATHTVFGELPATQREELLRLPDEIAQADWFRDRAITFIKDNPGAFVRMGLAKFMTFWWFSERTGVLYPRLWLRLYQAYYVVILALAAVGAWRLTRSASSPLAIRQGLLVGLFVLAISAAQSLYYVEGRHRWAIEPMVIALSGGGIAALLMRRR